MSVLDLPLRSTAERLIGQFGTPVLFRTGEQRRYDTATGGPTGTYDDEFEAKALVGEVDRDQSEQRLIGEREAGGMTRAIKLTVAAAALGDREPTMNWSVVLAEKAYRMVRIKPTYSGDMVVIYEFTVRR